MPDTTRRRWCSGLVAWGLGAVTGAQPAAAQAEPLRPERLARLDRFLSWISGEAGYLGAVALVAHRGLTVYLNASGHRDLARREPLAPDAIFRLYSLSKPVASAAALLLIEEGRLTLDDAVSRWLPEFAAHHPALRLRHLVTHTSGFALEKIEVDTAVSLQDYAKRVAAVPPAREPGTRWGYDGVNTEVMGRLLEVAAGMPFERLIHDRILQPLAMHDSGFSVSAGKRGRIAELTTLDAQGRLVLASGPSVQAPGVPLRPWPSGAGGLYSTAADFARFATMLMQGRPLLGRSSVEAMRRPHLPAGVATDIPGEGFGLGVSVLLDPAARGRLGNPGQFGWTGASRTMFFADPAGQLAGILLAQHLPREPGPQLPPIYAPFQNLVLGLFH